MITKLILFGIAILATFIAACYVAFCERCDEISRKRHEERMRRCIDFNKWCEEEDLKSGFMYMSDYKTRGHMTETKTKNK